VIAPVDDEEVRKGMPSPAEQLRELKRGIVDLQVEADLVARLGEGRPLRVKAGFDPTAPDLHLGHTVLMQLMRRFQKLGHQVIFLIGDYTALIGDPSGRNATRPPLSSEEIDRNARTYLDQVFKLLDRDRTEVRRNSEWLGKLTFADTLKLCGRYTVARTLEREDFRKRLAAGAPISMHEILYPLMQAYDSVALGCDVELGGQDQLFNLMVGRDIMPSYGQKPQIVMTVPLLVGTDGAQKMSKSYGNYIGVSEPPDEIFGKTMSISDETMWKYYELLSDRTADEIGTLRAGHPKAAKEALAHEMVARYHGQPAADAAQEAFRSRFTNREVRTEDLPEYTVAAGSDQRIKLVDAIALANMAQSKGDARRLIGQNAVEVDGTRVTDPQATLDSGKTYVVKVGKLKLGRVTVK
jgi:tyrosyl-tRNA synthetase